MVVAETRAAALRCQHPFSGSASIEPPALHKVHKIRLGHCRCGIRGKLWSISPSGIVATDFETFKTAVTEAGRKACTLFLISEIEGPDDQAPSLQRDGKS